MRTSWHSKTFARAAALSAMLVSGPALAGEYLKPAELAAKATAIAVVDVKLTRANRPPSITLVRTLRSPPSPGAINPDPVTWLSQCLADRKDLKHWLHRYPKWPARKLWKTALARTSYQAVVFLAAPHHTPSAPLAPTCGIEAMDLLHTNLHPNYAAYLKQAESLAQP